MATDDDIELQKIRARKAQQLMEIAKRRKEQMEKMKNKENSPYEITEEDKYKIMQYYLTNEAFEYWKLLYSTSNKKKTAETIFINVLYLVKIGFMEGKQLSKLGVKKLERKIDNIPPKITIKRKNEEEQTKVLD